MIIDIVSSESRLGNETLAHWHIVRHMPIIKMYVYHSNSLYQKKNNIINQKILIHRNEIITQKTFLW